MGIKAPKQTNKVDKATAMAALSIREIAMRLNNALKIELVYPSDFKMQDSERCHRVEFKENNAAE